MNIACRWFVHSLPLFLCVVILAVPPCAAQTGQAEERDKEETFGCEWPPTEAGCDSAELARLVEYPQSARERGIEGEVVVGVQVGTRGEVLKTDVRRSTDTIFEASALGAVRGAKYVPAIQSALAIKSWLAVTFVFELEKDRTEDSANVEEGIEEYGIDDYPPGALPPAYDRDELHSLLLMPAGSREMCGEWRVVVGARIDTDGTVLETEVRSATSPVFIEAAVEAVKSYRFTSGTLHGKPARMRVTVPVDFEIEWK